MVLVDSKNTLGFWDVAKDDVEATFPNGAGLVHGDTVLSVSNADCSEDAPAGTAHVLDLRTGVQRQIGEPCVYDGGEFSPDGRTVALWTPQDGAASSLDLLAVDGSQPALHVPNSTSVEYALAWDARGRVYFVADTYGETVGRFDPSTGESQVIGRADGEGGVYTIAVTR